LWWPKTLHSCYMQSSGSELSSVRNSNLAARWISAVFAFLTFIYLPLQYQQ